MHSYTIAATAVLAATVAAIPGHRGHGGGGGGWGHGGGGGGGGGGGWWPSLWEGKKVDNGGKDWPYYPVGNDDVFYFDETFYTVADAQQVTTGGQPDAKGIFKLGVNVFENTICYNITLSGVTGDYSSPAKTATHLHEAAKGVTGPPRVVFPNPVGPDDRRVSYGCVTGPFSTGIIVDGTDTGANFNVKELIENPSNYYVDAHTAQYVPGAVRGQLD